MKTIEEFRSDAYEKIRKYSEKSGYRASNGSLSPFPPGNVIRYAIVELEDPATNPMALGALYVGANYEQTQLGAIGYTVISPLAALSVVKEQIFLVLRYEAPVVNNAENVYAFLRDYVRFQREGNFTKMIEALSKAAVEAAKAGLDFNKLFEEFMRDSHNTGK